MEIEYLKISHHLEVNSDEDFETMEKLFKSESYSWCLFIGHICLEKLIKALYVLKYKKHAPFTHNLLSLCQQIEIEIPSEMADWLDTITSFNINARYDDYKREFYNQCNKNFTKLWLSRIKEIRLWIKTQL